MAVPTMPDKPWRKILYEKQGFADNYVDSSFLNELKKNLHVRSYDYKTLVTESTCITQQLSSIALFMAMYFYMEDQSISPEAVWLIMSTLTLLGYVCNILIARCQGRKLSLALCFSGVLSPVLVSLTETISTDTIYAMTTVMLLANLLFYNYQSDEDSVPGALSLNAAIFASVCLASRLHTTWHAFTTVTASFELFALWPLFRQNLKLWHLKGHLALGLIVPPGCVIFLLSKTLVGAVLYALVVLSITVICPVWLYCLQSHKNNIYGPWDEATPN